VASDDDEIALRVKREAVVLRRDNARSQIVRGSATLVMVPIFGLAMLALMFGFGSIWPIILWALFALGAGTWGVASIVIGVAESRATTRELRELEGIPEARLLR
jgi:hypothetical protein